MYAVIQYNNYRKEVNFKVNHLTNDLEEAKKVAFYHAKHNIPTDENIYKITSIEDSYCYVQSLNQTIIQYRVICVSKYKQKYKFEFSETDIYAVIEMQKKQIVEDIDTTLLCDDYLSYDYDSNDEDYEK
jgi:hypothetical protein